MGPSFILQPGARLLFGSTPRSPFRDSSRPTVSGPVMSARRRIGKQIEWFRIAAVAAGSIAGGLVGPVPRDTSFLMQGPAHVAVADVEIIESDGIPLSVLGIKKEDFCGERELRRRKTTKFSEAEEEIMDLDEFEIATQWYRDMRLIWAAIVGVGGLMVLYKGGVMWENWIQEQERKDMEEEIELTGTFIDPRAVRKDEEEGESGGQKGDGNKPDGGGAGDGKGPSGDIQPGEAPPNPPGDLESLEKLFGKS